jgi:hypothetical protein
MKGLFAFDLCEKKLLLVFNLFTSIEQTGTTSSDPAQHAVRLLPESDRAAG